MEPIDMEIDGRNQHCGADPLPFARSYQLEALEKAIKQNTIVFLETGSGKTLIAIMLLRSYAYLIRKPKPFFAVFLVPTVVLVEQQSKAVMMHTDLKVGKYWGDMGVDYWDAATWKQQVDEFEVLVMTPAILLSALRHGFLKLNLIKVLIFDECHNARGKHPYACIMTEFYHLYMNSNFSDLPRIFGMTASPIKAKGSSSSSLCWQHIHELENLMNSKVYTCISESVLAEYIPFSTPKLKFYKHMDIPYIVFERVANGLKILREKYEHSIDASSLPESIAESTRKRLDKLFSTLLFCLSELGVWLALKAAESFACVKTEVCLWGRLDDRGETIINNFCSDAVTIFSEWIPSEWCISSDTKAAISAGYLTSKVKCLVDSLLEYRDQKDLRCIIFAERIITAIVLQALLNELLPSKSGWRTAYMVGLSSNLPSQSRNKQHRIVEEFRKGLLNIIVATSILEEGLDVQSCNLVIRFDPSATVCSFIQSRGRARMQNSDFLIMVKSGDKSTLSRVQNYLASGDTMRQESLRHAFVPCAPLNGEVHKEACYKVQTTGAFVNLSSSVQVLYFYCSRLPCDGYFKSYPRVVVDKQSGTCTLHLPRSSPIQTISVQGNTQTLKQLACLEACKQLHQIGALTDYLVPDIVEEEAQAQELCRQPYVEEQVQYVPPELVDCLGNDSETSYYCYLIKLQPEFNYDDLPHDIVLAVRKTLECHGETLNFDLDADRGSLKIEISYAGSITLASEEVLLCRKFQVTIFRALLDHNLNKLHEALGGLHLNSECPLFDYLLLPSTGSCGNALIDWKYVSSVLFPQEDIPNKHMASCCTRSHRQYFWTKNAFVCCCMLGNSLVLTPHNGHLYCVTGILHDLDSNSLLELRNGESITYKAYYRNRYGIKLQFERESLLRGNPLFTVRNYLHRCRNQKAKEPSKASVELPPELCSVIMSPISIASFYSFSFAPSIMHRIESFLIAGNLKRMHVDHCMQNDAIPTMKVLEAITTKKCQEKFHLESLETLGDSFLKYAASQQLFKTFQNQHEGILSVKKDKIISNASLCKLGCDHNIPGFVRNEPFDPKTWIIPGDKSGVYRLEKKLLPPKRVVYAREKRKIKSKRVADVVEALIGAFLSTVGEIAALLFLEWLGIKVDFVDVPYTMPLQVNPEQLVNVKFLESLLNYSFRDASLLVEALTHGSYMLPEIPRCYQRLEFLGDAVLDYLITMHLYAKYPELSPGLLTDLRSASASNDCYAQSAVKAGLYKHILYASQELQRHIVSAVQNFEQLSMDSTFGWESETKIPKVLGDIIESLAGAILIDSGYNKDVVFQSIRPLLEPMITPDKLKLHPVREFHELCQKEGYIRNKRDWNYENGKATITLEVEANGITHNYSCSAADKNTAKKLACKALLKVLKDCSYKCQHESIIKGIGNCENGS
ncbi:endoribonuclease Dicer homolog 2 isoform X4 [Coffea arabica]